MCSLVYAAVRRYGVKVAQFQTPIWTPIMAKGISDIQLKALVAKPPEKRVEISDDKVDGLSIRIGPRGKAAWTYRFRVRGSGGVTARGTLLNGTEYHRISLGTYPAVSIKAARQKASTYAEQIERGENPLEALEDGAIPRSDTVGNLIDDYVAYANQTMRSARNAEWVLNRHMRGRWGTKPVGTIRDRDARSLVNDVRKGSEEDQASDRLRNGAAAEVRKWGSMLFEWARKGGRAKSNPFRDVPVPKLERRQRFLTMAEAKAVWAASFELDTPWGEAIRLLMLTGCREMEICGAKWGWFDSEEGTLLIPSADFKSERAFLVTLSAQAQSILDASPRFADGPFVFSTTNGQKSIAGIARKVLNVLHEKAEKRLSQPMDHFMLHDFRRTVRTHLSRLRVSAVVAQLAIGHSLKGLDARYNIYDFALEKREALQAWADELTAPAVKPERFAELTPETLELRQA